ncbi:hypothetical protein LZ31DRAFT_242726 [Colletotrichum somersetense]|nr:hypothetical protein LZ31DRAFT_242726 [Colletotrichum somersetense]
MICITVVCVPNTCTYRVPFLPFLLVDHRWRGPIPRAPPDDADGLAFSNLINLNLTRTYSRSFPLSQPKRRRLALHPGCTTFCRIRLPLTRCRTVRLRSNTHPAFSWTRSSRRRGGVPSEHRSPGLDPERCLSIPTQLPRLYRHGCERERASNARGPHRGSLLKVDAAKRRPRGYAGCPASLRLPPLPVAQIPRDSAIACVVCVCLASGLLGKKQNKKQKKKRKKRKRERKKERRELAKENEKARSVQLLGRHPITDRMPRTLALFSLFQPMSPSICIISRGASSRPTVK